MTRPRLAADDGSTMPLVIFFCALSLALVLAVTAVTSLYLERKRLFTLADGAALAGAEAFDLSAVAPTANGYRPVLVSTDVAAAVDAYLAAVPSTFTALHVTEATTRDGRSATVALAAEWHPPLLSLFVPEGLPIDVTSTARSVFG